MIGLTNWEGVLVSILNFIFYYTLVDHPNIHTYIHRPTGMHTYIQTYIYTYIHAYIQTYLLTYKSSATVSVSSSPPKCLFVASLLGHVSQTLFATKSARDRTRWPHVLPSVSISITWLVEVERNSSSTCFVIRVSKWISMRPWIHLLLSPLFPVVMDDFGRLVRICHPVVLV